MEEENEPQLGGVVISPNLKKESVFIDPITGKEIEPRWKARKREMDKRFKRE